LDKLYECGIGCAFFVVTSYVTAFIQGVGTDTPPHWL